MHHIEPFLLAINEHWKIILKRRLEMVCEQRSNDTWMAEREWNHNVGRVMVQMVDTR